MVSKTEIRTRIIFHQDALAALQKAYIALAESGVQQYSIGSRSLSRVDLAKIRDEMRYHESMIDQLETQLAGGGRRKAVGVIPRDI